MNLTNHDKSVSFCYKYQSFIPTPSSYMANIIPLLQEDLKSQLRQTIRPLTVVGFMSGTSLDGVDVAIIRTNGREILDIGPHLTLPYSSDFQQRLRSILGQELITPEIVDITRVLMDYHYKAYQLLINNNNLEHTIDLVALHGHTIFHAPKGNPPRTWQICDPEYLQQSIKKSIIFDFRSEDLVHGGEGAPLVPLFHQALSTNLMVSSQKNHSTKKCVELKLPLIFLNIGGVSNITVVQDSTPSTLLAGDMGPGNALINDYVQKHFGILYDKGGAIALSSQPNSKLVQKWLDHPYFYRAFPKSLDRDAFYYILKDIEENNLTKECAVSTLSELTVRAITQFLPTHINNTPSALIICGGGTKNHYFLNRLKEELPFSVYTMDECSFDGFSLHSDAIEAQAFAYLGARSYFHLPTSFPTTTGTAFPTFGGRILDI